MRAVVTGDQGFLGRHFVKALAKRGYTVVGVDIAAAELWDARDFFRFGTSQFDLAIHCAAIVGGRQKIEGAPLDLAVDLSLDSEFFQWVLRTEPRRAVYISSSAAYPAELQTGLWNRDLGGAPQGWKMREDFIDLDAVRNPDHLYGWSKLTGEMLARFAIRAGAPVTVVRPFSGYGADQSPDYPFRAFLERARRREDPFEIWGDGEQVRDFIHVSDIVDGTLELVDQGVAGPVNLGTGRGTSFIQLARIMTQIAGYRPDLEFRRKQPVGVRYRVADTTLLERYYQPKVKLEDAIEEALR